MVTFQANKEFDRGPYIPFLTAQGYKPSLDLKLGDIVWGGNHWASVVGLNWDTSPLSLQVHAKGGIRLFRSDDEVFIRNNGREELMKAALIREGMEIAHPFLICGENHWNLDEGRLWFLGRYLRNGARIDGDHAKTYSFRMTKKLAGRAEEIRDQGQMLIQMSETRAGNLSVRVIDRRFRQVAAKLTSRQGVPIVTPELLYQKQYVLENVMDSVWLGHNGGTRASKLTTANINRAYGFHAANLKAYAKIGSLWMYPQSEKSYTDSPVNCTIGRGRVVNKFGISVVWQPITKITQHYGSMSLKVKLNKGSTVQYGNSLISC